MILYLLICLISVFAGCGILSLIGIDVNRRHTFFLSPIVTMCTLTVLMGGLAEGGFSVGQIAPFLYLLCFGTAVLGVVRHGRTILSNWRSLSILLGIPLLILLPAIIQGIVNYSGGLCMDAWSYVTFGQALQKYPLGSEGWFPINVQYMATWGKAARFISSAFLAFLAPLSGMHNDTQEVLGRYLGWLFFLYASACLFFARSVRLNDRLVWVFIFLATLSGWAVKIINANNVDNALALCFLPCFFGILLLIPAPSIRWGIFLGAMLGAGFYAYPEGSAFIIAAVLATAAQRLMAVPNQFREFGRMGLAFILTAGLCVLPYAPHYASFLVGQIHNATGPSSVRPGEGFYHSLLRPHYALPGYWGLIPDFGGIQTAEAAFLKHYTVYLTGLAIVLTFAALFGAFVLLQRRIWSLPLFATGMTIAYVTLLIHFHYPYAAYKVVNLAWFAIVCTVMVTVQSVWETLGRRSSTAVNRAVAGIGAGLLAIAICSFFLQERIFYDSLPFKSLREFRKVSTAANLAQGSPIALVVDDTNLNIWAVHFLHNAKLYLADQYRGYMTGIVSLLDRSRLVDPSKIVFAVTDRPNSFESDQIFDRVGPYYIWDCRTAPCVTLTEVDNPNGLEIDKNGEPFFWMGKGETVLQIFSNQTSRALITADFILGPCLPGQTEQRILVGTVGSFGDEHVVRDGEQSFISQLHPGVNRILLEPLDKPKIFLPNDPRPLLIHVARLSVSVLPEGNRVEIREIDNQNGVEKSQDLPFFWMNDTNTTLIVIAPRPGIVELAANLSPGPSLVNRQQAHFIVVEPSGNTIQENLDWGQMKIDIPMQAGTNRIVMRATGTNGPNTTVPNDPRVMMIGFLNLRASLEEKSKTK